MNRLRLIRALEEYHGDEVLVCNNDGGLNRKIIDAKPTPAGDALILYTDRRIGVGDRRKMEAEND